MPVHVVWLWDGYCARDSMGHCGERASPALAPLPLAITAAQRMHLPPKVWLLPSLTQWVCQLHCGGQRVNKLWVWIRRVK